MLLHESHQVFLRFSLFGASQILKEIIRLLLGNDFKALLDVYSKVDDNFVCGTTNFVILEEDVCSELRDSLINHIIALEVSLGSRT